MKKRITLYSTLSLLLVIFLAVSFNHFKPENAVINDESGIHYEFENNYTTEDFNLYIKSTTEPFTAIFYDEDDITCQYLFNTLIPSILENNGLEKLNNFIYVNIEDLKANNEKYLEDLKMKYAISAVPAIANMQYKDTAIKINSLLQFNPEDTPFNEETVTKWFIDNGIIEKKK